MTQLKYGEADFEPTELGWTLASQDKIWAVFIFDLDSKPGDHGEIYKYERLYPIGLDEQGLFVWSYDPSDDMPVWTSRWEAEAYARELRVRLGIRTDPLDDVFVINWGDDARYEVTIIGRDNGHPARQTPKFKGSERAWSAMTEISKRREEEFGR